MNNNSRVSTRVVFPARFRVLSLAAALLGASLLAGCAGDHARGDSADAQSAGDKGNWVAETALAEKAYRAESNVMNEFNLATGYQRTGQDAKAAALYQDVVVNGKSTQMNGNRPDSGAPAGATDANLSDEAGRRIEAMAGRPAGVVPDQEAHY